MNSAQRLIEAKAILSSLTKLSTSHVGLAELQDRAKRLLAEYGSAQQGFSAAIRSKGVGTRQAQAQDNYDRLFPILLDLRKRGITSYQSVQDYLNANNVPSHSGRPWRKGMVFHLVKMLKAFEARSKGQSE